LAYHHAVAGQEAASLQPAAQTAAPYEKEMPGHSGFVFLQDHSLCQILVQLPF
jgi:hypothetical protein